MHAAVAAHDGYVVKTTGDGVHAAFATARAAIDAAVDAQLALARETWGETGPLLVRMGLHTGVSELRDGDYYGTAVNRAARIVSVAHGGQIVCSQATADLVRDDLDRRCSRSATSGTPAARPRHAGTRVPGDARRASRRVPDPSLARRVPGQPPAPDDRVRRYATRSSRRSRSCVGRSRLVTLTGTGGVGKTRLALQAAAAALPHFSDGAWFVDLAPIDDETFVASEVATSMGLPEHRQGTREEALVGALARRHALVVLDNCEHLVDTVARVADLVVRRCPAVTVLATSQEVLGVEGEAAFAVRPLPGSEAEQLFVERAEAGAPRLPAHG